MALPPMEQVFVTAKASFINQVVGSIRRNQRFPVSERIARELASMGLVELEKQSLTVQLPQHQLLAQNLPQRDGPMDAGRVALSQSLQVVQVSPQKIAKKSGSGGKTKARMTGA